MNERAAIFAPTTAEMWAISLPCAKGFVFGTLASTRSGSIEQMEGRSAQPWAALRRKGYRAVRVTVTEKR